MLCALIGKAKDPEVFARAVENGNTLSRILAFEKRQIPDNYKKRLGI